MANSAHVTTQQRVAFRCLSGVAFEFKEVLCLLCQEIHGKKNIHKYVITFTGKYSLKVKNVSLAIHEETMLFHEFVSACDSTNCFSRLMGLDSSYRLYSGVQRDVASLNIHRD